MTTGSIFNIQRYSIHDGPGVRTTVFLKGCPLSCLWCHNPEGQPRGPQLVYRESRCDRCGDCLDVCDPRALSLTDDLVAVDDGRCTYCGRCEEVCAAGALELAGKEMTVAEVVAEIERDTIFYDQSGGGVTFSGGEPLFQPDFLHDLLRACREREIRTALDTTGYASPHIFDRIAPAVDLFLFDLKVMDDQRHRALTGVSNAPILRNLRQLVQEGRALILRVPIVPGVNDDEENLLQIAGFARSLNGPRRIDLLPYHNIAEEKYRRLRKDYPLPGIQAPAKERMSQIARTFEELELLVHIGG